MSFKKNIFSILSLVIVISLSCWLFFSPEDTSYVEDYNNKIDFAIKQVIKFYGTEAKNVISIPPRLTVEERVAFIEGNTPTIYL